MYDKTVEYVIRAILSFKFIDKVHVILKKMKQSVFLIFYYFELVTDVLFCKLNSQNSP